MAAYTPPCQNESEVLWLTKPKILTTIWPFTTSPVSSPPKSLMTLYLRGRETEEIIKRADSMRKQERMTAKHTCNNKTGQYPSSLKI